MKGSDKSFVIAGHVREYDDPLEYDLHNLKIALRIQKENVAKTQFMIDDLEAQIKRNKDRMLSPEPPKIDLPVIDIEKDMEIRRRKMIMDAFEIPPQGPVMCRGHLVPLERKEDLNDLED